MAKKEKKVSKVVLERTYVVPLRKEWLKAPKYRRSKKAVTALKEFILKHMKGEEIKIGYHLNKEMWKHGIKNPPHKLKVNAKKDEKNVVKVELFGAPEEKPVEKKEKKPEAKKAEPKKTETKVEKTEAKVEKAKEVKAEEAKKVEKEEIKELKTEKPKVHHPPKAAVKEKKVEQHPPAPVNK